MKARIIRSSKREFDCLCTEDNKIIQATALGNLLKNGQIVVGDFVEIKSEKDEFVIHQVFERTSEVYRIIRRENKKKITASNVDLLVIVVAVSLPEYKQGIVDRYLLRAHQWEIRTIVIFNKMDEFNDEFDLEFEQDRVKELGVDCYEVSSKFDYQQKFLPLGFAELQERISGKTALMLGQSGVGKSKLISKLSGGVVELESRELAKVGKGTHTTTWAQLITLDNFQVVDSPGVRSFSIDDLEKEDLLELFPDLIEYSQQCKFNDCKHAEHSKGCAFQKVEDPIILSRLDSYKKFYEELAQRPSWEKNY